MCVCLSFCHSVILGSCREKGMWFWQTFLKENFPTTPFSFFSPSYPFLFSYIKNKFYSNKIFNCVTFSIGINWLNSSPWVVDFNFCSFFCFPISSLPLIFPSLLLPFLSVYLFISFFTFTNPSHINVVKKGKI